MHQSVQIQQGGYKMKTEKEVMDSENKQKKTSELKSIPLELLDDFPNHPFKVRDDEDMLELIESVTERGVLVPAIVRPKENGRYELISGHRRKRASECVGKDTLQCFVKDLDDAEAVIIMVDSNIQRSHIPPSEKAFAYKMKLDAMNMQGKAVNRLILKVYLQMYPQSYKHLENKHI